MGVHQDPAVEDAMDVEEPGEALELQVPDGDPLLEAGSSAESSSSESDSSEGGDSEGGDTDTDGDIDICTDYSSEEEGNVKPKLPSSPQSSPELPGESRGAL